jgi:hypothetical protein
MQLKKKKKKKKKKKIATRWKTAISFAEQKVELAAAVPPPY